MELCSWSQFYLCRVTDVTVMHSAFAQSEKARKPALHLLLFVVCANTGHATASVITGA